MMKNSFSDTLELLLDPEYNGEIVLSKDGQEIKCKKFCTLPIEDKVYFLLEPITKLSELEEDELLIFSLSRINFEFKMVTNREEMARIYLEYKKLVEKSK